MKFGLLCYNLPPSKTPHGAIVRRLLRDLPPGQYCLISSRDFRSPGDVSDPDRLPATYHFLPPPFQLTRGYRFGLESLRKRVNVALTVMSRTWRIARILRRERCDALVVCTGGEAVLDFPAAFLATRLSRVRSYAYLLDQYMNMVEFALGRSAVRHFESFMLKGATAIIAPNEFLRDEIRRRYELSAVVIHNPCDVAAYSPTPESATGRSDQGNRRIRIVYTGSVGNLYADALRNLAIALDLLGRDDLDLHMYTNQPVAYCESEGIRGRVVYHEPAAVSAMPGIQQAADVLFLPLAFHSDHPEHLRTSSPGKLGEFLAAGRPILVHVPAGSFTAWYFRHHDCGLVVDEDDPAALAAGLQRLLSDPELCSRYAARARERAEVDFAQERIRAQFLELIGAIPA